MNFKIEKKEKFTLVVLPEKLDVELAPSLKAELIVLSTEGVKNIIFDLKATRYADSSGLFALILSEKMFKRVNGICLVMGMQEQIKKLFMLSHMNNIFKFCDNLDQAADIILDFTTEKYDAD